MNLAQPAFNRVTALCNPAATSGPRPRRCLCLGSFSVPNLDHRFAMFGRAVATLKCPAQLCQYRSDPVAGQFDLLIEEREMCGMHELA